MHFYETSDMVYTIFDEHRFKFCLESHQFIQMKVYSYFYNSRTFFEPSACSYGIKRPIMDMVGKVG